MASSTDYRWCEKKKKTTLSTPHRFRAPRLGVWHPPSWSCFNDLLLLTFVATTAQRDLVNQETEAAGVSTVRYVYMLIYTHYTIWIYVYIRLYTWFWPLECFLVVIFFLSTDCWRVCFQEFWSTVRSARVQCHLVHCIRRMQCYIQFPFLDLNLLPTFLRLLKIISKNSDQFRTARQCYSRTQGQSRFRVYPGKLPVERKDAKGHSNR